MPHLWWAAVAASIVYVGVVATDHEGPWRAVKILPGMLLAGSLADAHPVAAGAMIFSALGDGLLLDKDRYLLHGMGAFLVGHLLFIPAFFAASGERPAGAVAAALVAVAVAMTAYLRPEKPVFRVAVPIYGLALAAMVAAATTLGPLGIVGGLLFLVSDALLSIRLFKRPFPGSYVLVMMTYYAAILTLAAAVGTHQVSVPGSLHP